MTTTDPPFCYDESGSPVVQGNGYLGDLWKNVAKCGLEHQSEDTGFDSKRFYDPIAAALGNVDALLQLFQETKKGDGMVSAVTGAPDSKPLTIAHDRKRLYFEAAKRMRAQADHLATHLDRFESFLDTCVCPLIRLGFPVDYLEADGMWVVDYGYKQMFAHFEAHFDSIVARGHYAVVKDDAGRLVYQFCQSPEYKLICTIDGCSVGLFELFGVGIFEGGGGGGGGRDSGSGDDDQQVLLRLLCAKRQSLLEKDLYEHILKTGLLSKDSVRLVDRRDGLHDNVPSSRQLCSILRDYLTNRGQFH